MADTMQTYNRDLFEANVRLQKVIDELDEIRARVRNDLGRNALVAQTISLAMERIDSGTGDLRRAILQTSESGDRNSYRKAAAQRCTCPR